jgi:hypothetical protein
MKTKKILITVPEDDAIWLEHHPEINKSGLFQKVAEYMMKNGKTSLEPEDIERAMGGSA